MPVSRTDRLSGGLWGLLVGDALGVPYEFHPADEIPPLDQIEMEPPPGFHRAHPGTPPGTWSDDGAQALVLLTSLLERGHLDVDDLGQRLVGWFDRGDCAVDGRVFDIGTQTRVALRAIRLRAIREGVSPSASGPAWEETNGNGSLMRVLPLALWHTGPDADLVRDARLQSLPTHGHVRSPLCCALYALWARHLLEQAPDPWNAAVQSLCELAEADDLAELDLIFGYDGPLGTGYVVSCLHSARIAVSRATTRRSSEAPWRWARTPTRRRASRAASRACAMG